MRSLSATIASFPDVPFALGVPPVLRHLQAALSDTATGFGSEAPALTADAAPVALAAVSSAGQWGVFRQDGVLAIAPDSFLSFDYRQDWHMPHYPMEQGAFQTYNKVQTPFHAQVTLTKGGSNTDRLTFLQAIETAANGTELYNISTPEITYSQVAIAGYSYRRSAANGVTLLSVELSLEQIRLAPAAAFSSTAFANGADQVNGGMVQPVQLVQATAPSASILASALRIQ